MQCAVRIRAILLGLTLAVCTLAHVQLAKADETADLEKGRLAYAQKRYDDADARFRAMLDAKSGTISDPTLVAEARMYWGATLLAQQKRADAIAMFERLIVERPEYEPDALRIAADAIELFIDTKGKMRERLSQEAARRAQEAERKRAQEAERARLERERVKRLEALASEEKIVHRNSRLVALLPFGLGQLQNGQSALGYTLLATQGALAAGTLITFPLYRVQLDNAYSAYSAGDTWSAQMWRDRAADTRLYNLGFAGGLAVVALFGIIHAQLTFVPERVEVRKRPLPPSTTITPTLAPLSDPSGRDMRGAMFGATGRF